MDLQNFSFFFADQFLKGTVVLVLACLASRVFRNASAAKRNAIWLAAFAALLLLPLTHLASPEWTWNPFARPQIAPQVKPTLDSVHHTEFLQLELPPATTQVVSTKQPWQWPDWKVTLVSIWCVGTGLILLRRTIASVQLQQLLRRSEPAPMEILHETLSKLLEIHSITRSVGLRISPSCHVPVTWGVLRPLILLPEDAAEWSAERIRIVLAHELGHIRRWDSAVRTLADLACAFHWFNPLAWMASGELRLTQEQACDDLVLNDEIDPAEYAAELVESVRRLQATSSVFQQALAMAQPSTLETRVGAIMDRQRNRGTTGFWAVQASIIAVVLSLLASALAQVATENPVSDTPQKNQDSRSLSQTSSTEALILKEWPVPATLLWQDAETKWPLGDTPRQIDAVPVLKEKGFIFPEGSNAYHITDLSKTPAARLFVRNTQENLDRIDDIITGALLKAQRSVDEKATRIIIPKLELHEATLHDAIAFLVQTSREFDPEKQGVKITISPDLANAKADGMDRNQARITLFSLKNIPLSQAMRYVTGLAGVTFAPTPEGYLVTELPDAKFPQIKPEVLPNIGQAPVAGANAMLTKEWRVPAIAFREKIIPDPVAGRVNAREILSEEGVVFLPGSSAIWLPSSSKLIVRNTAENLALVDQFLQRVAATIPAVEWAAAIATAKRNDPERKAFTKNDSGIVLPSLEFRDLSLPKAVELLMAKALEADPKKQGIKITIGSDVEKNQETSPSDGVSGVRTATLSLRDIPFDEALVYVAGLFDRKVESAPGGFRLVPHSAKHQSE